MGCIVSIPEELVLKTGCEIILTWSTKTDPNKQHTKKEYIKVLHDATYKVAYEIKWRYQDKTTQPFQVTIYKVSKEFEFIPLHRHVTVCVGNPVTLKKNFPFDLKAGERICIAAKNLSEKDFILMNCQLSLTGI